MPFDLWGLILLIIALVVIGAIQTAVSVGVMWGMHKKLADKFPETNYGHFDFENFQKLAFKDMITRLAIIFVGATVVLHVLYFMFIGRSRYAFAWSTLLFLLEAAAITAGLFFMYRLDPLRLAIIAGTSSLFYLICLWWLSSGGYLLN